MVRIAIFRSSTDRVAGSTRVQVVRKPAVLHIIASAGRSAGDRAATERPARESRAGATERPAREPPAGATERPAGVSEGISGGMTRLGVSHFRQTGIFPSALIGPTR